VIRTSHLAALLQQVRAMISDRSTKQMLEWATAAWIGSIVIVPIVTYAMHRDGDALFNDPQRPLEGMILYGLVLSLAPLFVLFALGFGVVEKFKASSWSPRKERKMHSRRNDDELGRVLINDR
jgi:hypothetical protein